MNYQPWKEAASLIFVARSSLASQFGQSLAHTNITATLKSDQPSLTAIPITPQELEQRKLQKLAKNRDANDAAKDQLRQQQLASSIQSTDYRIMMVKRTSLSSFMASAYVFPGGQVEMADFSPRWFDLFAKWNVSESKLNDLINRVKGSRPPMTTKDKNVTFNNAKSEFNTDKLLDPNIALRIAAIRETFEETGVLILKDQNNLSCSESQKSEFPNLTEWREKVRNDAEQFVHLCEQLNKCPDLWSLYEWWDWLTPISVGHKRFDTMFYVYCSDHMPHVVLDNREVTTLKWATPLEMLEEHTQGRVFLAPPQVYELSRLFHQRSFEQLKSYLPKREQEGVERWLPVIGTYANGSISMLPGDDLYPQQPDFIGKKPVPDSNERLEDMRIKSQTLNRIELIGSLCLAVNNQRRPACGHRAPISYIKGCEPFTLDSKL